MDFLSKLYFFKQLHHLAPHLVHAKHLKSVTPYVTPETLFSLVNTVFSRHLLLVSSTFSERLAPRPLMFCTMWPSSVHPWPPSPAVSLYFLCSAQPLRLRCPLPFTAPELSTPSRARARYGKVWASWFTSPLLTLLLFVRWLSGLSKVDDCRDDGTNLEPGGKVFVGVLCIYGVWTSFVISRTIILVQR